MLFQESCSYKKYLTEFCDEKRIPYKEISNNDMWLRDYLIETPNKLYIRNKNHWYCEFKGEILIQPYQKDDVRPTVPNMENSNIRNIDNILLAETTSLHSSNRCLEGGNYFLVKNKCDVEYVIIGERVIDFEKMLTIQKQQQKYWAECLQSYPKNMTNKNDKLDYFWYQTTANTRIKHPRIHYQKIFGTENILIVPNLTYHIDLQMAYVGKGIFLVHSFDKMQEFFLCEYQSLIQEYETKWPGLIAAKEKQVNRIVVLLQSRGFNAVKFCSNLYYPTETGIWRGTNIKSTFVNGIDVYSEYEKQHYFVTIDSPILEHKRYFCNLIQDLGITPYFVRNNSDNVNDTISEINQREGALRCQTNFISTDKLNLMDLMPHQYSEKVNVHHDL